MINVQNFVATLRKEDVSFFCGIPDSLLKNFCAYLTDVCKDNHVITANEGGAVGLATGHTLATGNPALVYMQNSGQGNTINPLTSLVDPDVYSIPMILLIGWRGEPGVKDEPQHVKQGKVTCSLFETLSIPTTVLAEDEAEALTQVADAIQLAKRESRPVALVVRKNLFDSYTLQQKIADVAEKRREEVIEEILKALPENAVVVSTTGMISREVYESRERFGQGHARDFLTVGAMGHASMIALGIAKAQPERLVLCLDGDGASLMQMGNMAIAAQSTCSNLIHIVLNNGAHDSVGGQPTVGAAINLPQIANAMGYQVLLLKDEPVESVLRPLFEASGAEGVRFLEIKVAKGARKDLGRPKEPPQENKHLFMETLQQ